MRRLQWLAIVAVVAVPAARAQSVPVGPAGALSSLTGLPFDVPILADWSLRSDKLGSFALRLSWDTTVLSMVDGAPGTFGNIDVNEDSIPFGVLRLAGANPAGASGLVTLGIGRFIPRQATSTSLNIQLSELYAAGTFADVLPSAVPQNGQFCPARGYWGDPDLDRSVGSRDALIALSASVGLNVSALFPQAGLADVDADGAIKAKDALIILSYAVGLSVGDFRVMRLAVGSCGADLQTVYSVGPNGDTLVADGDVDLRFELHATSSGTTRVMPDVIWRSANPDVLALLPDGRGLPVAPGTVTIIGRTGLRDSAMATITLVSRRTRHYIDALAAQNVNRLGTFNHPFSEIGSAQDVLQPGDTIIVRPGRYEEEVWFDSSVVILGKPEGDAWPTLVPGNYGTGLSFYGGGRSEIHAIRMEGFEVGVSAWGPDTLLIDSVQITAIRGSCANTAIETGDIPVLSIRRSRLVGDGKDEGCADGIGIYGNAGLVVLDTVMITDFGYDGMYVNNADSIVIRASNFTDNYSYGVEAYAYAPLTTPGVGLTSASRTSVPPASSLGLVVQDSRFLRNYDAAIYTDGIRSAALARNVIDASQTYYEALYFYGWGTGQGYVSFSGDSIRVVNADPYCCGEAPRAGSPPARSATSYGIADWIDAEYLDSVVISELRVSGSDGGYFYNVGRVAAQASSFKEMAGWYYSVFDVGTGYSYSGPRPMVVLDSVHITGALSCWQCKDGLQAYYATGSVNRLRAENLGTAIYFGDSTLAVTNSAFTDVYQGLYAYSSYVSPLTVSNVTALRTRYAVQSSGMATTVTNSAFTDVYTGIYAYSYLSPRPRLEVQDVTANGAYYGIESYNMVTVVDRVALTDAGGGYEGVYAYGGGADTVRNSTITGFEYGVDIEDSTAYVADNTFPRPVYDAIYTRFYSGDADTSVVVNNVATCDAYGAEDAGLIDAYYANYRMTGNTVSGCNWGIYLIGTTTPIKTAVVRNNVFSIPSQADYSGVWLAYYRGEVVGNTVTGGAPYADGSIRAYGSSTYRIPALRVDSNTVQQPQVWAVRVDYVDSLQIRGNLIEDLTVPCCFGNVGAISTAATRYRLSIAGNTIRRTHGSAIFINQGDSATAVVDTNAISGADSAAVYLYAGKLVMRNNNVRNNARYGVWIPYANSFVHQLHDNAFKGNGLYAVASQSTDSVDAEGNWWGVDNEQPGPTGAGTDSVFGKVNGTSPRASEPVVPTDIPPLTPRVLATASVRRAPALEVQSAPAQQPRARGERPVLTSRPSRPGHAANLNPTKAANRASLVQSRSARHRVGAALPAPAAIQPAAARQERVDGESARTQERAGREAERARLRTERATARASGGSQ
ncbi:MAG: right-handed parallel beta-helix repeat-containing protein [Gemmatimonadetes bacterium]|nr:right-handed parallel beta-helix repeat-containing protein [Gemmatimonadota bacterium]